MNTLHFQHPHLLAFLWVPLLVVIALALQRRRRRLPGAFASPEMLPRLAPPTPLGRYHLQAVLIAIGLTAAWIALARPIWGEQEVTVIRQGRDILVLLDVSRSMLARDVGPNRLARAKADLLDLLATLSGDRIGLMAFRGRAVLLCPLTTDYAFFRSVLDSASPASAPAGPTDIGHALDKALEHLQSQPAAAGQTILLLTDGEDLAGRAEEAARRLREAGIPLFAVGYGTPAGETIPGEGESPLTYQGETVRTRLESQKLKRLADATGGAYWPIGAFHSNLGSLYHAHLRRSAARDYEETVVRRGIERFEWFLLPALLAFLAAAALSPGRPLLRQSVWTLLLITLMAAPRGLYAATNAPPPSPLRLLQEAERHHRAGRPLEAARLYEQAASNLTGRLQAIAEFNAGCSFLAASRPDEAARLFSRRALSPDPRHLPFQYNLGCALLDMAETLKGWETNAALAQVRAGRWKEAAIALQSAALSEASYGTNAITANLAYAASNALAAEAEARAIARLERFGSRPADQLAHHLLNEQRAIQNDIRQALQEPLPQRLNRFDQAGRRQQELAELIPLLEHSLSHAPAGQSDPQTLARLQQHLQAVENAMREAAERLENGDPSAESQLAPIEKGLYALWKALAPYPALLQEDIRVQSNLVNAARSTTPEDSSALSDADGASLQREAQTLTHLFRDRFTEAVPEGGLPSPPDAHSDTSPTGGAPATITAETRARILALAEEAEQLQGDAATAWEEADRSAAHSLGDESLRRLLEIQQLLPKETNDTSSATDSQPANSSDESNASQPKPEEEKGQESDSASSPDQSQPSPTPESTPPSSQEEKHPLSDDETRALLERALLREKEYLDDKARRMQVSPSLGDRDW